MLSSLALPLGAGAPPEDAEPAPPAPSRISSEGRAFRADPDHVAHVEGRDVTLAPADSDDARARGAASRGVPVYYPEGERPRGSNRHFGTDEVLLRADAAPDLSGTGLTDLRPVTGAPGFWTARASDAWSAPAAAQAAASKPGVLLAHASLSQLVETRAAPNDPLFPQQWHLRNTGQNGGTPFIDANLSAAWDLFRGEGVLISVVDDGLQFNHSDLAPNYNGTASHDHCDGDSDPRPLGTDGHGTAAGGVAAARGDNGLGVSGAAFRANLTAQRLIACAVSDAMKAAALGQAVGDVHVSTNSWGPADDGMTLGTIGPAALAALQNGVQNGRHGRGTVYVWANGNGRHNGDDGNYDAHANSRYVISVGAVGDQGNLPFYAEPCACMLVAAPSNSGGSNQAITTSDLTGPEGYNNGTRPGEPADADYSASFGGTSSATPLVAGVVALMLQANPDLSWRDVQAILALSANRTGLQGATWTTNGAGFPVSHEYGFGRVDAGRAVQRASGWQGLAPEVSASASWAGIASIPDGNGSFPTPGPQVVIPVQMNASLDVERVVLTFNASHSYRGDLRLVLRSPSGTESVMIPGRSADAGANFVQWSASSTHFLGEGSSGTWQLKATDLANGDVGNLTGFTVTAFGTPRSSPPPGGSGNATVSLAARRDSTEGDLLGALRVLAPEDTTPGTQVGSYSLFLHVTGDSSGFRPTTAAPAGDNPATDNFSPANVTVRGESLPLGASDVTLVTNGTQVYAVHVRNLTPTRVNAQVQLEVAWRGRNTTLTLPIQPGAEALVSPTQVPVNQASTLNVTVRDGFGNPVPSASLRAFGRDGQPYPGIPDGWFNGTGAPGAGQNGVYTVNVAPSASGDLLIYARIGSDAGGVDTRNHSYARVQVTQGGGPGGPGGNGSQPGGASGPYHVNGTGFWDGNATLASYRLFDMANESRTRYNQTVAPGPFDLLGVHPGDYGWESWLETDGMGGPGPHEPRGFLLNGSGQPDVNLTSVHVEGNLTLQVQFVAPPPEGWQMGGPGGGPGGPGGGPGGPGGGFGCTRDGTNGTATVRGYVRDSRRMPVEGAGLNFQNRGTRSGEGFTNTNATGYFTCVVPGGSYQIEAFGNGGQAYHRADLTNGTETWVNLTLSFNARPPYDPPTEFYGGTVWGNATVGGAGVAGIRVNVFPTQRPGEGPDPACNDFGGEPNQRRFTCWGNGETNATGGWVVTALRDGTYSVQLDGSAVNVSSQFFDAAFTVRNATLEGPVDVELPPHDFPQPAFIRGRVNTTGNASVEAASVQAYPHCMGPMEPGTSCGSFAMGNTDENGEYTLVVTPGRYGMSASTDGGFYVGPPLSSERRDCHDGPDARCVAVSQGNTTWVNFSLRAGHVLSGRVVKQVDGGSVPVRAFIQAEGQTGPGQPPRFAWGQTAFNNSGWFSLTLEPGQYRVRVEADRFEEPDLGSTTLDVTIPEVGDAFVGNVTLGAAAIVEGVVTGPDGEPVPFVNVFANTHREPGDMSPGGFGGWANTGPDGRYRLGGLQTGSYDIEFSPPFGSSLMRVRNESVQVSAGNVTTVDARLVEGGVIAGYVLKADGTGVSGAFVDAWWMPVHHGPSSPDDFPTSGGFGHTMTDSAGYYEVRGLAAGTFGMFVRPPFDSPLSTASLDPMDGDLPLVTIGETTLRNFTLSTGASVRGCVKEPTGDTAVSFAWTSLFSRASGFGGGEPSGFDGCFQIRGVRPGTYDLEINPPFGSAYGRTVVEGVRVNESQDVDLGVVRLRAGVTMSGRVIDTNGAGIPNVFVNAFQIHEDGPMAGPGAFGFAQTDSQGNFTVRGLVAGKYGLHVQPPFGTGLSSKFVDDVRVPETGLSGVVVRLGGGGWINGTVLGADGSPLRGAWVGAWSWEGGSGSGGVTGPDGTFNLSGLSPADDYNFDVQPPYGSQDLAGYHQFPLQVNESEGTLPGPARDGRIQLGRGGALVGRVVGSDGAGVGGAFLNVGGGSTFGWAMSDESGNFTVRGLNAANGTSLHVFAQPGFGSAYAPSFTTITWAPDATTGVHDMGDLVMSAGRNVTGTVTRSGTPVADVDVHMWPSLGDDGRPMGPPGGGSATTDSGGNFTVRGLPAGYYDVSLQPRDGSAGRFIPRAVLVGSANDTTGLALTLEAGGDLPVQVNVFGSATGIADAQVDCFNADTHAGRGNRTDGTGLTVLQGLPAGAYKCRVAAPGYTPRVVENVTVVSGSNPTYTVSLTATSTATVTGRYANGTASSGYFVILAPADDEISDGDATGFNTTGSDGSFTIPSMPYGSYDVKVVSTAGVLVAKRENVSLANPTEALGDLTYDPTLGG